jgi:hypothetical protein
MHEEDNKTCFIICPIGEENSSIRKRADDLLEFIITPCLTKHKYEPIRADHISKPGMITNQIIRNVIDSDLVIADLFEFNPNVLYELAIRHVTRKPYIQLMERGKRLPFDIGDVRTIFFDIGDIRSVNVVITELEKQIKSIIEENLTEVESPISRVQDIKELLESRDPQKQSTAVILEQMSVLQSTINEMSRELDIQRKGTARILQSYFSNYFPTTIPRTEVSVQDVFPSSSKTFREIKEILDNIDEQDLERALLAKQKEIEKKGED